MREHWARRSVAGVVLGLFLLLTVGAGEATHICPVHDPVLAGAVASSAAMQHGTHAPMAGHQQMDAAQSHGDHQSGHDHTHCCCTGLACVTNAVNLPSHRLELPDVAISTSSAPELPEYARSAAASAYFIPFANGPPTLSERSA
jgi:hypothetical protein